MRLNNTHFVLSFTKKFEYIYNKNFLVFDQWRMGLGPKKKVH